MSVPFRMSVNAILHLRLKLIALRVCAPVRSNDTSYGADNRVARESCLSSLNSYSITL